jgi:hypothetical protein
VTPITAARLAALASAAGLEVEDVSREVAGDVLEGRWPGLRGPAAAVWPVLRPFAPSLTVILSHAGRRPTA